MARSAFPARLVARLAHTLPVATLRRLFAAVVGLIGLRVLADSIKAPARGRAYRTLPQAMTRRSAAITGLPG